MASGRQASRCRFLRMSRAELCLCRRPAPSLLFCTFLFAAFSDFGEIGPQLQLSHLPPELGQMPALSSMSLGGHRVSRLPGGWLDHVLLPQSAGNVQGDCPHRRQVGKIAMDLCHNLMLLYYFPASITFLAQSIKKISCIVRGISKLFYLPDSLLYIVLLFILSLSPSTSTTPCVTHQSDSSRGAAMITG